MSAEIRLADLSAEARAVVRARGTPGTIATRARRAPGLPPARAAWRCHDCAEVLPSWAAVERHRDARDHFRFDCETTP